jgi:hypothetical protein
MSPDDEMMVRLEASGGRTVGGHGAVPAASKSTCPPARRMLIPSGWLPLLSSATGAVEALAGESPVWYT